MKYSEASQVQKLKHLTHLEDLVLEAGLDGVHLTVDLVEDLLVQLGGNTPKKLKNVTMKFDGAPSLVFGVNPENDRFFVATKSAFNKDPKLNYSVEDIETNHGHAPGLVEKLKYALQYLPDIVFDGVYQGDLMYTREDLQLRQENDVSYVVFKPNTLIYAVPYDSEIGQRITNSKMGLVVHTKYEGTSLTDMKATFSFSFYNPGPETSDVVLFSPNVKNLSGMITFSKEETDAIDSQLESAMHAISVVSLRGFQEGSPLSALVSQYKNRMIREGREDDAKECYTYLDAYVKKEIESKKTERGKESVKNLYQDVIRFLEGKLSPNPLAVLNAIFRYQRIIADIKLILIQKLESMSSTLETYLPAEGDAWKKADGEGFVISDIDGNVVKLVDRSGFSAANFLQGAFQKQNKVEERVSPNTFTKVDKSSKRLGLEPDTRVPPTVTQSNLIYRDPDNARAQKQEPLAQTLTKSGIQTDTTYRGTTPAVLVNDETGTSTILLKNKKDLLKNASAKGSVENIHLSSFRASVREAVKKSSTGHIHLRIGSTVVRNVVGVQKVSGDRVKADFVLVDDTGNPVYWISHKAGTNALGFQQYGGLSDLASIPRVIANLRYALIRKFPDLEIPSTTRMSFEIKDPRIGLLAMYGKDYGNDFGENNVNALLQGDLILRGFRLNSYILECSHMLENGELPNIDDPYYPVFTLAYRNSRSFFVGSTGFANGRIGIFPRAYATHIG